MATRRGRKILVVMLNDPNVYTLVDGGKSREGGDTTTRAQIRALMKKRDKATGLPLARLAEIPEQRDREFDQEVLQQGDGQWNTPSAAWERVRDQRKGAPARELARGKKQLERRASERAMKGLAKLVDDAARGDDPDDEANDKPPAPKPQGSPKPPAPQGAKDNKQA